MCRRMSWILSLKMLALLVSSMQTFWEFNVGDVPGKEDVLACAWQNIRETRLSPGILEFVLNRTKDGG